MNYSIKIAGDSAVCLEFEQHISAETSSAIRIAARNLAAEKIPGVIEIVPTFCSLLICYDPLTIGFDEVCAELNSSLRDLNSVTLDSKHVIEIPVCYGGEYGPDLDFVAKNAGLTPEEVIRIHSQHDYLIDMLGFLPGFAYLGGLDERIHTPRLDIPRTRVEAGAVGIGGAQTGLYPLASPAGWQIIGRTPLRPYNPERDEPFLYEAGDYIRFVPVSYEDYQAIETLIKAGKYRYVYHTEEA